MSAAIVSVCLISMASPAVAQDTQPPQQADAELGQMRERLDEAEASYQYALRAAQAGDLRGAIAALERVLQIDPSLDNVALDLGQLYLQAGRPDLARKYLERARNSPAAPAASRRRAEEALRLANGQSSPHSFYGSVSVGAQYETNPNGAPEGVYVPGFGGGPILLDASTLSVQKNEDWAGVASAYGEYTYKMPQQAGHEFVVDGGASTVRYNETESLNSLAAQVRVGPRLYFGTPNSPVAFVRPFIRASYLALDDQEYYSGSGGGIDAELRQGLTISYYGTLSWENRDFEETALRPRASDEDGDYFYGSSGVSWRPAAGTTLRADAFMENANVEAAYQDRQRLGLRLAVTQALSVGPGMPAWLARASAGYQENEYDTADPFLSLGIARKDRRSDAEIGLAIPLTTGLALDLRVAYTDNDSNIINYKYDNTIAAASLAWRF